MLDKPDAAELLEAVAAFLTEEAVPAFEGRKRFHALVAANVVRIVARELRLGGEADRNEIEELSKLLDASAAAPAGRDQAALVESLAEELCRRINAGEADAGPWRERVVAYLRSATKRRLEVDNPKLVG